MKDDGALYAERGFRRVTGGGAWRRLQNNIHQRYEDLLSEGIFHNFLITIIN
jgi:hypothetical protein